MIVFVIPIGILSLTQCLFIVTVFFDFVISVRFFCLMLRIAFLFILNYQSKNNIDKSSFFSPVCRQIKKTHIKEYFTLSRPRSVYSRVNLNVPKRISSKNSMTGHLFSQPLKLNQLRAPIMILKMNEYIFLLYLSSSKMKKGRRKRKVLIVELISTEKRL